MKRTLAAASALLCMGFATSGLAAQYTWNLGGTTINPGGGQLNTTACGAGVACQLTIGSTTDANVQVKARAYSTFNDYADGSAGAGTYTGNWISSEIARYSGGLGIKNRVANDTGEGSAPEHAVDNQQIKDVLVFELPSNSLWDIASLAIGWSAFDSDIQMFVGGSNLGANYDFRNVCFTGCANAANDLIGNANWTSISATNVYAGGYDAAGNALSNSGAGTYTDASAATGRYLVVSGALGNDAVTAWNDFFKVKSLVANTAGIPPVPSPGAWALLVAGLLGMAYTLRRPGMARIGQRR